MIGIREMRHIRVGRGSDDCGSMLMLVSSMLIFGTIGIFRRYIPLSSGFLAFTRGMLGGLSLIIFMGLKGGDTRLDLAPRQLAQLIVTGAAMGINWILLFESYTYTTVATATLCYYMQPTIVLLLSPVIFGERLTGKRAICAGIAIIGMVLVSGVTGGYGTHGEDMRGILLGLGAALLYAIVVIMNKRLGGIDAYKKTAVQLLSAGIAMIPYLCLSHDREAMGFDALTVALLLIVGIVHTGIAYLLYFGSMDGLEAQTIALFSYIDPVSALVFSSLLLQEPLSMAGMIGAAMILGSAIIGEAWGRGR
ncbi:EamA/RhaT family transporter [Coriobacteriales bacterium OH1046]|nr:EamA/RhaT family transporter [Coriobacteriales bacterium OH1046]